MVDYRQDIKLLGAEYLHNTELLVAFLGNGCKGHNVHFISYHLDLCLLHNDCNPSYDDLISIDGIGHSKACSILAFIEYVRRNYLLALEKSFVKGGN